MDMKRNLSWLKFFNGLLSSVLVLLGYTSCNSSDGSDETPLEYGSPYAKYEIKGKVVDKESQAGVEGARVIVKPLLDSEPVSYYNDTVYTDKDGGYSYQKEMGAYSDFRVVCEDPSDTYKADSTQVKMSPEGGEGWYLGSDSETVDFGLEKKSE